MSLVDYSSMEDEIKNAQAPKVLPDNTEAELRIIAVNSGVSEKNGCKYYQLVFDIPAEPMAKDFQGFFWDLIDAQEKITDKQRERNKYEFENFRTAFGIDISKPFSWEDDLVGRTGRAILGIKRDSQYGDKNTVKKFVHGPASGPSKQTTGLDPYAVNKDDIPF
jgi:hypothetical protein